MKRHLNNYSEIVSHIDSLYKESIADVDSCEDSTGNYYNYLEGARDQLEIVVDILKYPSFETVTIDKEDYENMKKIISKDYINES